jgi:hypothetical protein
MKRHELQAHPRKGAENSKSDMTTQALPRDKGGRNRGEHYMLLHKMATTLKVIAEWTTRKTFQNTNESKDASSVAQVQTQSQYMRRVSQRQRKKVGTAFHSRI